MGNQHPEGIKKRSDSIKSHCTEPPTYLISLSEKLVKRTKKEENAEGISEANFLKYVCDANKFLGQQLFQYMKNQEFGENKCEGEKILSSETFIAESMHLLGLITDGEQLEYFINVYADEDETIAYHAVYDMIHAAYQVAKSAHQTCCLPDDILAGVVKAAMHRKTAVNCKYLHSWMCQNCPRLLSWMHKYFSHTLTVAHHNIEALDDDNDLTPVECGKNSCLSLHPTLIWLLNCTLPQVYIKHQTVSESPSLLQLRKPRYIMRKLIASQSPSHWTQLYHSNNQGLSVNRFQHHVFGYHGPTLMIITGEDGNMFCVAADEEWKDSKHFWGGSNSYVLQLIPEYKVIETGSKMLYFNLSARGFPTGFQIGKDNENRSITIDTDLNVFQFKKIPYKLKSIEVMGCGNTEVKEIQQEIKKLERKDVEKARKVKINAVDWADHPDRYLLQMGQAEPKYALYNKTTQSQESNN